MTNDPLKIVAVCGFPPNKEGEANYSSLAYRELLRQYRTHINFSVIAHIVTDPQGSVSPNYDSFTIKRITGGTGSLAKTVNCLKLIKELLSTAPDVVHFQGAHTNLYGGITGEPVLAVLLALRLTRTKSLVTIHSTWTKRHIRELCKAKGMGAFRSSLTQMYFSLYYSLLARLSHRINILVAGAQPPIYDEYIRDYDFPKTKTKPETHPCSVPILADRQRVSDGETEYKFLSAGFIRPDKGIEQLIDAFSIAVERQPNCRLIVAGEPVGRSGAEYARSLRTKLERLPCRDKITLDLRYLPENDFQRLLAETDSVILSYQRAIGASGPMHHAISVGKQVIAPGIDQNLGLSELIELYDPQDTSALAEAMIRACSSDKLKNAQRFGEFCTRNNWTTLATEYMNIYKELTLSRQP